jgi:hypothetical protein
MSGPAWAADVISMLLRYVFLNASADRFLPPALFYNGVNSSIDAYRGKHDTYGAIAAGALSGVIYKATGTSSYISFVTILANLRSLRSWRETGDRGRCGYGCGLYRLELCQAEGVGYRLVRYNRVVGMS